MENLYFANKIFRVVDFERYAKYHSDQLGCHVNSDYFIDNNIYVFTLVDGKYVDSNGNEYEEVDLPIFFDDILCCDDCIYGDVKPFSCDCRKDPHPKQECIGIINTAVITNLLNGFDCDEAIKFITKYNSELEEPITLIGRNGRQNKKVVNNSTASIKKCLKKPKND